MWKCIKCINTFNRRNFIFPFHLHQQKDKRRYISSYVPMKYVRRIVLALELFLLWCTNVFRIFLVQIRLIKIWECAPGKSSKYQIVSIWLLWHLIWFSVIFDLCQVLYLYLLYSVYRGLLKRSRLQYSRVCHANFEGRTLKALNVLVFHLNRIPTLRFLF